MVQGPAKGRHDTIFTLLAAGGLNRTNDMWYKLPEPQFIQLNLCLPMGCVAVPLPEKFLMHGIDVYSLLYSLPSLTSHDWLRYLWGLGRRGIPTP